MFFSSYRKIFGVVFAANLVAFIVLVAQTRGLPALDKVGTATSANLMVAFLIRQEHIVNILFEIFTWVPHSLPVSLRRRLAKVFHYGGLHSGCSVAAVVWYVLYTALATKQFIETRPEGSLEVLTVAYILITLFVTILVFAHPRMRAKFHNHFEWTHRGAGWTALGIFWAHNIYGAELNRKAEGITLGKYLVNSASFWCLCVSTICIFWSWVALRPRSVRAEKLSKYASRWHFDYRRMKGCSTIKTSTSPLFEWHGFATIPNADGKGFSIVVANAGDWTGKHIEAPPKKLWIRGYDQYNLMYSARLFKKVVVVATGSGIGPCLSLFWAKSSPFRVLWITRDPKETYGDEIINMVLKADPRAVIISTSKNKPRPDMVKLTHQLYTDFDAEAVFIISNPSNTRKLVYGLESRGVAAYGAIFDS